MRRDQKDLGSEINTETQATQDGAGLTSSTREAEAARTLSLRSARLHIETLYEETKKGRVHRSRSRSRCGSTL